MEAKPIFGSEHRLAQRPFSLVSMTGELAARFGGELAQIDPWLRLGYSAVTLTRYLARAQEGRTVWAVVVADEIPAACLVVRPDWLRGPLLEMLAILPPFQGQGLGRELILWLAAEAESRRQANLWTISSTFNQPALAFYQAQGFKSAGTLDDLIVQGEQELLLRMRLDRQVVQGRPE